MSNYIDEWQKRLDEQDLAKKRVDLIRGEHIYKQFKFWCMGFAKGKESFKSVVAFREFMKAESIELTEYQRKHLLTNYFGFVWNEKENKWEKVK